MVKQVPVDLQALAALPHQAISESDPELQQPIETVP
jgi:hypothetical protein